MFLFVYCTRSSVLRSILRSSYPLADWHVSRVFRGLRGRFVLKLLLTPLGPPVHRLSELIAEAPLIKLGVVVLIVHDFVVDPGLVFCADVLPPCEQLRVVLRAHLERILFNHFLLSISWVFLMVPLFRCNSLVMRIS